MPTVPKDDRVVPFRPQPSETDLMMALAVMKNQGRVQSTNGLMPSASGKLSRRLGESGEKPAESTDTLGFDLENRRTGIKPLDLIRGIIDNSKSDDRLLNKGEIDQIEKHLDSLFMDNWLGMKRSREEYLSNPTGHYPVPDPGPPPQPRRGSSV